MVSALLRITGFCFVVLSGTLGLPTTPKYGPNTNVQCTSYGGLCDISFGFGDPPQIMPTSGQTCACPGNVTCPTKADDPARVVSLKVYSGEDFVLRLSYCQANAEVTRTCRPGEVAVVMEGESPLMTRISSSGIRCRCSEPLTLHKARPDGLYTVQEYTCGKPECNINRSRPEVCEIQTSVLTLWGIKTTTEVFCTCPAGFSCRESGNGNNISLLGDQKELICQYGGSYM